MKQYRADHGGSRIVTAGFYFLLVSYAAVSMIAILAGPVGKFDESIPLLHAMLIRQGYTPNLDFYSVYPPLNLYMNALAFSLLGKTVIAARAINSIFYAGVLALSGWYFGSRLRTWGPLVPAVLLVFAASIGGAIALPSWPGFALSLAALLVYLKSRQADQPRLSLVALSGVFAALAALCRINFGSYAIAAIGFDSLRRLLPNRGTRTREYFMTELRTNVVFIVPVVVGCVGFCGWIFGRHIDVALSQFIVTAQRVMVLRGYLRLEFSDAFACAVAFPAFWFFIGVQRGADTLTIKSFLPLLTGVALVVLGLIGRDHLRIAMMIVVLEFVVVVLMHFFVHRLEWDELSFLLFFCFLLHYYLSRADWPHWRLLLAAAALLTPFLFVSRYTVERREFELSTSTGTALSVLTIVTFVLVATPDFRPEITMLPNGLRLIADLFHDRTSTDSDRMLGTGPSPAAWNYVYPDTDELMTLRYIRQRSNDSTPLFVGSVDHSRVFWNDLRMYWLADRPIGVRTFQLEARIATEAPVQLEIVANLEQDKRTWIVLDNDSVGDDGISAHRAGSKLLDDYISDHFRQEARFGNYLIFTRVND